MPYFYPRSPCGERLQSYCTTSGQACHFYPRSPCGERRCSSRWRNSAGRYFYPRSPCGERLSTRFEYRAIFNFYPRSPCGERRSASQFFANRSTISIHALLAESDPERSWYTLNIDVFLSTLSLRRATEAGALPNGYAIISIHALLAESDRTFEIKYPPHHISIHALLAESDIFRLTWHPG